MKYYYVYDIEYSQTDKTVAMFYCRSEDIADILKRRYPNARYYNLIRKTEYFHTN